MCGWIALVRSNTSIRVGNVYITTQETCLVVSFHPE